MQYLRISVSIFKQNFSIVCRVLVGYRIGYAVNENKRIDVRACDIYDCMRNICLSDHKQKNKINSGKTTWTVYSFLGHEDNAVKQTHTEMRRLILFRIKIDYLHAVTGKSSN